MKVGDIMTGWLGGDKWGVGLIFVLFATLASGCQSSNASTKEPSSISSVTSSARASPSVQFSPKNGAQDVRLDQPITVTVTDGVLSAVNVTDLEGNPVGGAFDTPRRQWQSSGNLVGNTSYTVTATATYAKDQAVTSEAVWRTLKPKDTAGYDLMPAGDGVVGVGMPVVVQFVSSVDENRQDDVERRLSVTTVPEVKGSWGWLDARQVMWRPEEYWAPGTKVSVQADLSGVETRPGLWVDRDDSATFEIGDAMVSTVDIAQHTMSVRRNGSLLRTIPITTGKENFRTRNGVKILLSQEPERRMNAETTGVSREDPEYYDLDVKYAMRLTWSGEFIHAAPWSVDSQGRANVSHGCTGMSTKQAEWFYGLSQVGDVVNYVGGEREMENANGYTLWNLSFDEWESRSALSPLPTSEAVIRKRP
ncbi:MAG: Ig-like domain-containing protein [Actinomycetota bacterium]